MIWVTWRQFRAQSITAAAFIAAFGVILLVSGLNVAHLYSGSGLASCQGGPACATAASTFIDELKGTPNDIVFYAGIYVMYLAPALMGMFWGAPLVARELEAGTFRLAWNQSVDRSRWMVVKLGLIGLAAMAAAGLLSIITGWWAHPIYTAAAAGPNSLSIVRLAPPLFGAQGIVPVGYAAFGFALGVTAGVLIRRTIPAMAVALAGFAFIQLAWASWIRSHLIAPLRESFALKPGAVGGILVNNNNQMFLTAAVDKPGAWIISNQTVDAAGHPFTGPPTHACMSGSASRCNASIGALHLRSVISYQPASRFWELQWTESAIFLALAVLLAWFCTWWVRRRMT